MEKYGVDEDTRSDKNAEQIDKQVCPDCNSALRDPETTGVLICPKCGTQPFEGK